MELHEATINGKRTMVSIPEDPTPAEELVAALQGALSPKVVAAALAFLQPATTNDPETNKGLAWLRAVLMDTLGGEDLFNATADELGL